MGNLQLQSQTSKRGRNDLLSKRTMKTSATIRRAILRSVIIVTGLVLLTK